MENVSATPTVSVNDVIAAITFEASPEMPEGWTGIHWTDTDYTECRACIEDLSWRAAVDRSDAKVGVVLFGPVDCANLVD